MTGTEDQLTQLASAFNEISHFIDNRWLDMMYTPVSSMRSRLIVTDGDYEGLTKTIVLQRGDGQVYDFQKLLGLNQYFVVGSAFLSGPSDIGWVAMVPAGAPYTEFSLIGLLHEIGHIRRWRKVVHLALTFSERLRVDPVHLYRYIKAIIMKRPKPFYEDSWPIESFERMHGLRSVEERAAAAWAYRHLRSLQKDGYGVIADTRALSDIRMFVELALMTHERIYIQGLMIRGLFRQAIDTMECKPRYLSRPFKITFNRILKHFVAGS